MRFKRGHKSRLTHGYSKDRGSVYFVWKTMTARCVCVTSQQYKHYGGRGIKVCRQWKSFVAFFEDMGERPKGYWIDRIDNNGDYCKDNCRWVTPTEQQRNKRTNRLITLHGKTRCLAEWAEITGISRELISYRITHGKSPEAALAIKTTTVPAERKAG